MMRFGYMGKNNISGERIRQQRRALDITQEQLVALLQLEQIEIDQNSISRIEKGKRVVTDYEARALAKVLEVDIKWLLEIPSAPQG